MSCKNLKFLSTSCLVITYSVKRKSQNLARDRIVMEYLRPGRASLKK